MHMKVGRVKGFPIQFAAHQWQVVLVGYDVSRARGHNTPEMDEIAAMIPNLREGVLQIGSALGLEDYTRRPGPDDSYGNPYKVQSKTIRVRAAQVKGALQLLRYAATVGGWGMAGTTLSSRIHKLEEISELDLLADAGR